jgi:hypothetical protein
MINKKRTSSLSVKMGTDTLKYDKTVIFEGIHQYSYLLFIILIINSKPSLLKVQALYLLQQWKWLSERKSTKNDFIKTHVILALWKR